MNRQVMFSSASDEWATPLELFNPLHAEFAFEIDLAASRENHLLNLFLSKDVSALDPACHWRALGKIGFCNPPYSRGLKKLFVEKAAQQRRLGFTTVMLLPARTDTKDFHTHVYDAAKWKTRKGIEMRLLPGRLTFGGADNSAPFPSMIVVFRA